MRSTTTQNPAERGLPRGEHQVPDQAQQAEREAHERNKAVKSAPEDRRAQVPRGRRGRRQGRRPSTAGRDAASKLDKAASKGVIHKNQAANRKSAIAKKAASL